MEENLTKLNKILFNLSDFDRKLNQYDNKYIKNQNI